jgi:hypothetical protein
MVRSANIADSEPIAKILWKSWHHLKTQQIPTPLPKYAAVEVLSDEIGRDLSGWLMCESSDPQQIGFFGLSRLGTNATYKRLRFPESAIQIEHFAFLLKGEILLCQFQALAAQFPKQSMLLRFPSQLRDAYWAALKAGFRILGECPLIIGTFVWFYLDREEKFLEIQNKLRRDKIIVVEPDAPANRNRQV